MLKKIKQLTEAQVKDLHQLKALSKEADNSIPNLYLHLLTQARSLPSIVLYYEQQRLMGFLSLYLFYKDAVEIALMIDPAARRRGIALQLIEGILPLIQELNYSKLIFSSPADLNNHWLTELGFSYQHSEYYMERNNLDFLVNEQKSLTFRSATMADIPQLCLIDAACFFKTAADSIPRFHYILNEKAYQVLLAFEEQLLVAKLHLRWQERGATLSDIAVLPTRQGQGLGTALIAHSINYALNRGNYVLNLEVETHNQRALSLYSRLGFLIQNVCDYWEITTGQLEELVASKKRSAT